MFLKVSLAPKYTSFEGGVRAEKTHFLCQKFPESA